MAGLFSCAFERTPLHQTLLRDRISAHTRFTCYSNCTEARKTTSESTRSKNIHEDASATFTETGSTESQQVARAC